MTPESVSQFSPSRFVFQRPIGFGDWSKVVLNSRLFEIRSRPLEQTRNFDTRGVYSVIQHDT